MMPLDGFSQDSATVISFGARLKLNIGSGMDTDCVVKTMSVRRRLGWSIMADGSKGRSQLQGGNYLVAQARLQYDIRIELWIMQ